MNNRLVVILTVVLALVAAFSTFSVAQDFDWRKYEGEEIRVLSIQFYYTNLIQEKLGEFEEMTGIDVNLETYSEDQFRDKITTELIGRNKNLDVFATSPFAEGTKFTKSNWYEPLGKYIDDPDMTNPNYDPGDFIDAVWNAHVIQGERIAVPLNSVTWLLMYRKDLYEQEGLEEPETMEELLENAKVLDEIEGVSGYVGRGRRAQAPATWGNFLGYFGGQWVAENWEGEPKPGINSPSGVAALEFYANLMKNYANEGAATNHWYDVLSLMQQGKAAQVIDTNAWQGSLADPEKSEVVDKVGWAPPPLAKGVSPVADLWSWSFAISPYSDTKGPSWYFIQWVTGKEMQKFIQLKEYPTARNSAWQSDEFREIANEDWLDATLKAFQYARPLAHPYKLSVYQEADDTTGNAIVQVIQGQLEAEEALDQAAKEIAQVMNR